MPSIERETEPRLSRLETGRAGMAVGMTFVPSAAMSIVTAAGTGSGGGVADVCRELALDFAFVTSSDGGVDALGAVAATGATAMWVVDGPFYAAAADRGWTKALSAAVAEPESLLDEMDSRLAHALTEVRLGIEAGAQAIVIAEDLAGTTGPIVPPDFAIAEMFPRLERLVAEADGAGLPTILHTDGDVRAFLLSADRVGFTGAHVGGGLGWEAFERLYQAAREEGLVVLGGIPTSDLAFGPPQAVAAGVRAGVLAQRGGLLVADDGGITTAAEFSAFVSAVEAARGRTP